MTDETPSTDVIQGTLDMLILKALSLEPMHGFGIARRIEQTSRGVFKVNPGSLLIAFQRLERDGLVDAAWQQTGSGSTTKPRSGPGVPRPWRACSRRRHSGPSTNGLLAPPDPRAPGVDATG